jgi:Ser/Thr protein kinase RdoA (MazF antagonist)
MVDPSPLSPPWAGRLAAETWDLDARAEPLAGEVDHNFLLTTADGRRTVLKVAPPGTDETRLACQLAALEHLEHSPVGPIVQRVVPTGDGRTLVPVEDGADGRRLARMLSYLDGVALVDISDRPPRLLDEVGRTLARLDLALADFDHAGAHHRLHWDMTALLELGRWSDAITDRDRRVRVGEILERFESEVIPRISELPRSVIHNDANDHNLLVTSSDAGRRRLAGIIDFGDLLASVTIAELAIAVAYLMLDRPEPLVDAAAAVRGYHSARPLTPAERELLPELVVARLCASVLMAARGRRREPDNTYLQISQAPVWRLLESDVMTDRDRFVSAVEGACR